MPRLSVIAVLIVRLEAKTRRRIHKRLKCKYVCSIQLTLYEVCSISIAETCLTLVWKATAHSGMTTPGNRGVSSAL